MAPHLLSLLGIQQASQRLRAVTASPSQPSTPTPSTSACDAYSYASPTSTLYSISSDEHNAWGSEYDSEADVFLQSRRSSDDVAVVEQDQALIPAVLVLGLKSSGKSTLVKQLVLQSGSDIGISELRRLCRISLYWKTIQHLKHALDATEQTGDERETTLLRMRLAPALALEERLGHDAMLSAHSNLPLAAHHKQQSAVTPYILSALSHEIKQLLGAEDSGCEDYIREALHRICSSDFVPTDADILNCHFEGSGIEEHLSYSDTLGTVRFCDVSKACGKRPIWSRFFQDAACILFVIDTSSYDHLDAEQSNQLEESFRQLDKVRKDALMKKANIHVVLNKTDLLKRKIKSGIALSEYMHDFRGLAGSFRAAVAYMKNRVERIAQEDRPRTALSPHLRHRSITVQTASAANKTSATQVQEALETVFRRSRPRDIPHCDTEDGMRSFLHF